VRSTLVAGGPDAANSRRLAPDSGSAHPFLCLRECSQIGSKAAPILSTEVAAAVMHPEPAHSRVHSRIVAGSPRDSCIYGLGRIWYD